MAEDLIAIARDRLFTAVLSDVLDAAGRRSQAMHPGVRPLDDALVMVGRARTGLYADVYHVEPGENPYELEIRLVDDLSPDEVVVLAAGASGRIAPWGELLSTACRARRAAGCVTDGLVRDIRAIRAMRFPVFAGASGPSTRRVAGRWWRLTFPWNAAAWRCDRATWSSATPTAWS